MSKNPRSFSDRSGRKIVLPATVRAGDVRDIEHEINDAFGGIWPSTCKELRNANISHGYMPGWQKIALYIYANRSVWEYDTLSRRRIALFNQIYEKVVMYNQDDDETLRQIDILIGL